MSISPDSTVKLISVLRDTGAAQSFILESTLSFLREMHKGTHIVICGIEFSSVKVPLHTVFLTSDLVSGPVKVGVHSRLPVESVSLILGNVLAGGKIQM